MTADERSDPQRFVVPADYQGERIDVFLAGQIPAQSRSSLRRAITAGLVTVDGETVKPSFRVTPHQTVEVSHLDAPSDSPVAEDIPLEVLHEDDSIVAINKPAGMVVHPAKGHWSGTLTSALAYHFQELSGVGGPTRPGIVHRLDRDTSGVIVIAKTDAAHLQLATQFEARTVAKEYLAVVRGCPDRDQDVIDQPIGAHPYQREKMAIRSGHSTSRPAQTRYQVNRRFRGFAEITARPKTGRTHQIRVHLAHIGYPVVCDRLYAGHAILKVADISGEPDDTVIIARQALHARRIEFVHPTSGEAMVIEAPIPEDLEKLLCALVRFSLDRSNIGRKFVAEEVGWMELVGWSWLDGVGWMELVGWSWSGGMELVARELVGRDGVGCERVGWEGWSWLRESWLRESWMGRKLDVKRGSSSGARSASLTSLPPPRR